MRYFICRENPLDYWHCKIVSEDNSFVLDVECPHNFFNPYQFIAKSINGDVFKLESKGPVFFRKHYLFKNDEQLCVFGRKLMVNGKHLEIDPVSDVYEDGKKLFSIKSPADRSLIPTATAQWETDRVELQIYIATLLIINALNPILLF